MPEPIIIVAVTTCALSAIGTGIKIIRDIIKKRREKKNKNLEMERKLLPIKVFDSGDECSICLELIDDNCCTLKCSHNFHKECIEGWFMKEESCPLCRDEFDDI